MTQGFQRFTKRYVNVIGGLIGLAVVSSILIYSGCGMTSSPNIPTNPTPTPDTLAPTSIITSPTAGASVSTGTTVSITGTASDTGGGTVARVEVSVDGGLTYSAATGTTTWSFNWTPATPGPATIKSRAIDSSGNQQNPPVEVTVTVRDAMPPTSTITSPKAGEVISTTTTVSITGTASDAGGGTVARVEVSVDGGATYSPAIGTTAWSFNWTPATPGPATIRSRAVDDSGNQQDPPAAVTVTVPIRVPLDRPTIQSAIDVANDGDTALVAPGTYREFINFRGKAITVTSENGPDFTIIDGSSGGPVAAFASGEGRDSVLNGFTLQNGAPSFNYFYEGGGVAIQNSSPTITNNVIRNNQGCRGGGIGIGFGSPLIRLNTITGNNTNFCSGGGGSGISVRGASSVEILDNVISDNGTGNFILSNSGGGIYLLEPGTPIVKRNIIKGNTAPGASGGGIYIEMINASDALIVQNLIIGNQADDGGGVSWNIHANAGAHGPILVNNTIAENDATTSRGSGIFAGGFDTRTELTNNIIVAKPGQSGLYCNTFPDLNPPIIRFNNIFSAGGMAYAGACPDMTGTNGNISADPLFANPTLGDYHLQQGSPSIDSGTSMTPNLPDKDLDGHPRILDGDGNGTAIVDMGVYEFLAPPSFKISLQLDRRSGMRRNSPVRFFDGVGVRFPRATRLFVGRITAGYQFTGNASK